MSVESNVECRQKSVFLHSDTPLCEPSDVEYLPDEESVRRIEEWMEMAVADTLVRNDPGLASCKQYVR